MKAEAFVARYRPGIGLSGVLLDNIAIILWVWIGDEIGENTETAVDGFRGADRVLFIKDRERTLQAPACYSDKSHLTLYCTGWRLQDSTGRFVYG